jgi:hypothetical protein
MKSVFVQGVMVDLDMESPVPAAPRRLAVLVEFITD